MLFDRVNRLIFFWLGIILTVYLIHRLSSVLIPFLVAFGLAYLGNPLVLKIESKRISRVWAVSIVFVGLFLLLLLILLVVIPQIINQILVFLDKIPTYYLWLQDNIFPRLEHYLSLESLEMNKASIQRALSKSLNILGEITSRLAPSISGLILSLVGFIASLVLIPMITFYLMRDWMTITEKMETLIPRSIFPQTMDFLHEANFMLSSFLRGQLTVMFCLACIYGIGLSLIGVEYSLVIGLIAGLISFIPYFGATSGVIMGLLVAWFQYGTLTHLILVGIVFGIGQLMESFVLTPVLIGDKLGMHPIAVVFALMVGGSLFGFVGILLALPVCAVLMVALRRLYHWYVNSDFYNGKHRAS
ncbi:AI-2E family transporter [Ignatzschineria ureiclastica]|uniref:AI-2E family transporter n=1 Tax=Ignatzschineria ureiclastica TaxID=472582 RepID=A0A2U2AGU1_9GAMM|nr:AI-2E family transporter [Ignatzschineria ureiclastica]PWD81884.1 AI-2E family transporter [Ignatzschineria ureiclastica]GGZ91208.1 AI-2E family transporter [Ignatzschineria ureiclastica]